MTYPICWASSVNDWYWASGDTPRFLALAPDMARVIDNAADKFLQRGLEVQVTPVLSYFSTCWLKDHLLVVEGSFIGLLVEGSFSTSARYWVRSF